ncbi:MAG: FG-GAP-like repeat-containing protein [Cyanobacteria bacterium P01_E01_bin.42]
MTQYNLQLISSNPFEPLTPLQVERFLTSPVIVDFDGDGNLDAFVGTTQGDIFFIQGLANNQFDNANPQINPFGLQKLADIPTKPANATNTFGTLTSPAVVDIDGDSDLDMFVGEYDGFVYFFENRGDNTFEAPVANPFGITHSRPSSFYYAAPAFIDADGDGFVETAYVGGYNTNGDLDSFLKVYTRNPGETEFQQQLGNDYPFPNVAVPSNNSQGTRVNPTLADFDGDGDFDVFLGQTEISSGTGLIRYFQNEGSNTSPDFVEQSGEDNPFNEVNQQRPDQLEHVKLDLVDFLENGVLEAFAGTRVENGIRYFILDEPPPTLSPKPATQYKLEPDTQTPLLIEDKALIAPILVDFDRDGKLDLFVGTETKELIYYRNAENGTFEEGQTDPFDINLASVPEGLIKPAVVDLDGDNELDIIVGDRDGNIHFFKNNGDNTFAASEVNPFGLTKVAAYASPTFVDDNNDGEIDWAFIGAQSSDSEIDNYIKVFKNNNSSGNPSFAAVALADHPFRSADLVVPTGSNVRIVPEFIDWDQDGDLDAFLGQTVIDSGGNGTSEIRFFENRTPNGGSLTFTERTDSDNPFNNVNQSQANLLKFAYPTLGDFLDNGELEAFSGSQSANDENGLRYLTLPEMQPDPMEDPMEDPQSQPDTDFSRLTLERDSIFKMGSANSGSRVIFQLKNINITQVSEITISFLDASDNISFSEVLFSTLPPEFQPRGFTFGRQKLFLKVDPNQRFKVNIQTIDRSIISQEANILEIEPGQFELKFPGGITIELEQSLENPPIGVGDRQRSGLEILDLESVSGIQNATFTVTREANYTNEVYFYRIDDENGTIDGLAPGQTGYAEAAIRNRVNNPGLQVSNERTNVQNGSFEGGFLYAPVIIANGTVNDFLNLNPNNFVGSEVQAYFVFGEANSDRTDHIILLGNNAFGFEDLVNGGDNDFNDIVVETTFA